MRRVIARLEFYVLEEDPVTANAAGEAERFRHDRVGGSLLRFYQRMLGRHQVLRSEY